MKPVPAPAIIDGVEWTVRDSGDPRLAYVDFSSKTMVVPMDCGEVGDLLRNHEMAHVAITPRDLKQLEKLAKEFPNRTLQAAEDCRVYVALQQAGIDTEVSHWPDSDIQAVAALPDNPKGREEKLRGLLATRGTADYSKLASALSPDLVAKAEELFGAIFQPDISAGKLPGFDKTIEMAREAHRYCLAEPPLPSDGSGVGESGESDESEGNESSGSSSDSADESSSSKPSSGDDSDEQEEKGGEEGEDESRDGAKDLMRPFRPGDLGNREPKPELSPYDLTEEEKKEIREILGDEVMHYQGSYYYGQPLDDSAVKLTKPKLSRPQKGHATGNRKVSTDTGSVPRRLSRYATDSAVFARTVKKGFASVLVDCSGSMSFTMDDVNHIVDSLPHCNVAVYSGGGYQGEIVLVAKDGKRCEEIPGFHGGNVVDMQAVEWLSRQRGPRYWICDGIVTGKGDEFLSALNILRLCRIVKLAKIQRFGSIDALLKRLAAKSATAY